MTLTEKQKTFCREYIVDLNATQAAIRAGYSEKTATASASRLLMNVKVQHEIKKLMEERNTRTNISADDVIRQLARIAFMDIKDMIEWGVEERNEIIDHDEDGEPIIEKIQSEYVRLKDREQIDGTLVQSVKMTKYGMAVEFPDRMRAIEMLAKHTGVFDDRPNVAVDVSGFVDALKETAQQVGGLWEHDPDNDPGGDNHVQP